MRCRVPGRFLLGAVVAFAALVAGAAVVAARPAAEHLLTPADTGSTVQAEPGDIIVLNLPPSSGYLWTSVSSTDPTVAQPLAAGGPAAQAIWNINASGTALISATATPACVQVCSGQPILFTATVVSGNVAPPQSGAAPAQPAAAVVTFPAGYNLIGVPTGTVLPVTAYSLDPTTQQYVSVPAGTPLLGGTGYWAYFPQPTTVNLPAGAASVTVQVPPGSYVLVGNPSATASATITGADFVQVYDPRLQVYLPLHDLPPGSGALVYSVAGGTITISAAAP